MYDGVVGLLTAAADALENYAMDEAFYGPTEDVDEGVLRMVLALRKLAGEVE